MPYTAIPDHRIAYDIDGTVVAYGFPTDDDTPAMGWARGIQGYISGTPLLELNDQDFTTTGVSGLTATGSNSRPMCKPVWMFFPEKREVTAYVMGYIMQGGTPQGDSSLQGSNDTTNGMDGTWETASFPSGLAEVSSIYADGWRSTIKPISFVGGKTVLRWGFRQANGSGGGINITTLHLFGEKYAGETPHDLIFIDHDTTPGVEYASVEDFGDRPLGTSVVRQFRMKNVSASRTATNVNLQCNDTDFAISTDGVTWVVTINIASLAPGAESATMYVRCTTPAPGNTLGPRANRIVCLAEDGSGGNFFA